MTVNAVGVAIESYPKSDLIIVTGGEPLIHNLQPLMAELRARFRYTRQIHIETSGSRRYRSDVLPDWFTVSPKHASDWHVDDRLLAHTGELKYVVDEDFDPQVVHDHIEQWGSVRDAHSRMPVIYLMPEGSPPRPEMVQRAIAYLAEYPHWRFGPRLQYAYPDIAKMEGLNNKIVTVDEARKRAKELAASQ